MVKISYAEELQLSLERRKKVLSINSKSSQINSINSAKNIEKIN